METSPVRAGGGLKLKYAPGGLKATDLIYQTRRMEAPRPKLTMQCVIKELIGEPLSFEASISGDRNLIYGSCSETLG